MLWLTCIIVPLLSVSLLGGPTDPEVMQKPTGKNQCSITPEVSLVTKYQSNNLNYKNHLEIIL